MARASNHSKRSSSASAKKDSKPGVRKSSRRCAPPQRFKPSGYADVPSQVDEMVHLLAIEAARKCELPMDNSAIAELEKALEPAMQAFYSAACGAALKAGRNEVTDDDFETVLKMYQKSRKK